MKRTTLFCMLVFLLCLVTACTQEKEGKKENQSYALIPTPVSMQPMPGNFNLSVDTKIITDESNEELHSLASYLSAEINNAVKMKIPVSQEGLKDTATVIHLVLDTTIQQKEGYTFVVQPERVIIRGKSLPAIFYGIQTFLQLLYPQEQADVISIPAIEIQDYPKFSWRGMHFDVSRHFFSVSFIKKMIDAMAMHKLNTFHWHLTDDQGWRIEIKKYPRLISVGAWRKETVIGHMLSPPLKYDGKKYGGFYTQEQIKEVVAYAKGRYITIVPEIEMPGHAMAALSAYPEYSCTGGPFEVFTGWGETEEAFCAGKEKTFHFIEDVLDEVMELFPGSYIHVGGDECSKKRWEKCADCQKRIKKEHLNDEIELQSYFIKRVETYLAGKGKKLIGWDEILEGGLPERATVMSWQGEKGGVIAGNASHDVVMTPGKYCYFDHYQGDPVTEPLAIGHFLPLDSVYSYDPFPKGLDPAKTKHILGAQANVWTEYIDNEHHFEYMVFPRLCAMAEILWSPKEKQNYADFIHRMDKHYLRLGKKNIHYKLYSK